MKMHHFAFVQKYPTLASTALLPSLPHPPPPQTSSWRVNMSTENVSSLQLHNSWDILHISRDI